MDLPVWARWWFNSDQSYFQRMENQTCFEATKLHTVPWWLLNPSYLNVSERWNLLLFIIEPWNHDKFIQTSPAFGWLKSGRIIFQSLQTQPPWWAPLGRFFGSQARLYLKSSTTGKPHIWGIQGPGPSQNSLIEFMERMEFRSHKCSRASFAHSFSNI